MKLLCQPACGLGVAGKHDHAADRPVKPVRDAEVDVAGLVILLFQIFLDLSLKCRDAWWHALRQEGRRLGHGNAVIVLKQDLHDYSLSFTSSGLPWRII